MSRRPAFLRTLLAAFAALIVGLLTFAPAGQAAGAPQWGELAHFGDNGGELKSPEIAFGVNPQDGSAWAVDVVTQKNSKGIEEKDFRIQKFEQVSGAWQFVASRIFATDEAEVGGEEASREAQGIAFDATNERAYVLIDEEKMKGPAKEEQAASELWAFSTKTNGKTIEPAPGTNGGVLVPRTEENLKGAVGQSKFAPNTTEKGSSLVKPGGITVNPINHEILLAGSVNTALTPSLWAISEKGTVVADWEDKAKFFECEGCVSSPAVTASGRILALSDSEGEIFEFPSSLSGEPKRVYWAPTTRLECETLEREKQEGKNVELCPFQEKLTTIDSGALDEGGEMNAGPEGNLYVHIKVPFAAHGQNKFGAVLVLGPSLEEIGWTGGGSSATETRACAVNETGEKSGGAALVAGRDSTAFMFERGQAHTEGGQKILELGPGGSTSACPLASASPPQASVNKTPGTSFPLSANVEFSSTVVQANALSTEWEFEHGVTQTTGRQQETTFVEHKFAHEGKFKVLEKIHTDDLASPPVEVSTEVTITGPPKVENEKATGEGGSETLSGDVNPNGGRTTCEFQYALASEPFSGAKVTKTPCPESPITGTTPIEESIKAAGLEAGKEYHFRIVATSGGTKVEPTGTKFLFTGGSGSKPTAETAPASAITQTGATLKGQVNPDGEATTCEFEYGTTTAYGTKQPCPTAPGEGTTNVEETVQITGLTANTTYHFRLVAKNGHGAAETADREFKTLAAPRPTAETGTASAISSTGATLGGKVNPEGAATTCKFLYGPTPSYGKEAACETAPGSGTAQVSVSATISGLTGSTVYHYKLIAESSSGKGEGADAEFKTLEAGAKPSVETVAATGVSQEGATLAGSVNPHGETTTCQFEYGTTTSYGKVVACPTAPGNGKANVEETVLLEGLTAGTTYHFRLAAKNALGEAVTPDREFKTAAKVPPSAETGTATAVSQAGATLNGKVNPNGVATSCKFLYGPTTAYGKEAACEVAPGSGTTPVAVSATLAGLSAGTPYHFKLVAESSSGTGEGADAELKTLAAAAPSVETEPASGVAQTTATLSGKVDPNGQSTTCEFEYGTTTAYGTKRPCSSEPGEGTSDVEETLPLTGLLPGTTYHFRLTAKNATGETVTADREFKTLTAEAPSVETTPITILGQTTATLAGKVDPHGQSTTCEFEYGTTTAYGTKAPCTSEPGEGTSDVEETLPLTGLLPGTTYHFRLAAKNAAGEAVAADREFKTLTVEAPSAETTAITFVGQTGATLTGKVNPHGRSTTCRFVYGPTTAYGKEAPCASSPGSGNFAVNVSAALSGLTANTVYHYKVIAESEAGKAEGADAEFKTNEVPPSTGGGGNGQGQGTTTTTTGQTGEGGVKSVVEASPNVAIVASASPVASSGGFSIKLSCPQGAAQCAGTVTVKTMTAVAAATGAAAKAKKAILTLASASFTIAGGSVKVVSLHLSSKAKKLLAKLHTIRARVTIVSHNTHGETRTTTSVVTLKAAKKHH